MGTYNKVRGRLPLGVAQMTGSIETPGSTEVEVLQKDKSSMVLLARGTTVPTDTEAGFAKGCLFIDTDVTTGISGVYENIGTTTSCNFDAIGSALPAGSISVSEIEGLADAEIIVGVDGDPANNAKVVMSGDATMNNAGALTLANASVVGAKLADSAGVGTGTSPVAFKIATGVYDFSVDGGTIGTISLADTCTIPDNAIVAGLFYDVLTTFTSATDAATVTYGVPTDGNFMPAVAISDGSNPFDIGPHSVSPASIKLTAARNLQITIAVEALTAGKAVFSVIYWVSQ